MSLPNGYALISLQDLFVYSWKKSTAQSLSVTHHYYFALEKGIFCDWITSTQHTNGTFMMSNCVPAKKDWNTCFARILELNIIS